MPRGCIGGLLGRNGSGKTTMIRILLGLEPPTRGRTLTLGEDSTRLSAGTHGRIGYVAERAQITPAKARVHFHRARKTLKKQLACRA